MEPILKINLGKNLKYQVEYYTDKYNNSQSGSYYTTIDKKTYKLQKGTLHDLLNNEQPSESSFGSIDGTKKDSEIRNSKEFVKQFTILDENNIAKEFEKMTPSYLHKVIDWKNEFYANILLYEEGGFFLKHTDTKKQYSFATVLIFPPAVGEFEHQGGILKIGNDFEFESSKNTEWVLIAFEPTLPHECTEVLSGKRIVIKTTAKYNKVLYPYFRNQVNEKIPDDFEPIAPLKNKKEILESKLSELKQKLITSINNLSIKNFTDNIREFTNLIDSEKEIIEEEIYKPYPDTELLHHTEEFNQPKLLKEIDEVIHPLVIIVLENFYHDPIWQNLFAIDLRIFREIKTKYPNAYLKNKQVIINNDKFSYDCDFYGLENFDEDSYSYGYIQKNQKIIKFVGFRDGSGKLLGKKQEYNDSDYDTVYYRHYTCIIIPKIN